jgi:hypothetical protein
LLLTTTFSALCLVWEVLLTQIKRNLFIFLFIKNKLISNLFVNFKAFFKGTIKSFILAVNRNINGVFQISDQVLK